MTDVQEPAEPSTFLSKVDKTFAELKAWLIHEHGEHMSIHNAVDDARLKVLDHAADHFDPSLPESPATVLSTEPVPTKLDVATNSGEDAPSV